MLHCLVGRERTNVGGMLCGGFALAEKSTGCGRAGPQNGERGSGRFGLPSADVRASGAWHGASGTKLPEAVPQVPGMPVSQSGAPMGISGVSGHHPVQWLEARHSPLCHHPIASAKARTSAYLWRRWLESNTRPRPCQEDTFSLQTIRVRFGLWAIA